MQFFTCLSLLVPLMLFFHLTHSVTADHDHEAAATEVRSADHTLKRLVHHHVHQAPKRGPGLSRTSAVHGLHNDDNDNDGGKTKRTDDLSVTLDLWLLAEQLNLEKKIKESKAKLDSLGR
uniref:Ctr_106_T conopeptide n=1 Tax=Conus tribblei TaxID=101761 RepID=A0A0C9R7A0_CONTD